MIMTAEEITGIFRMLGAYFQGDWNEDRNLVWAEAFQDLTFDEARSAVVALGRTAKFPTVAEFLELVEEGRAEQRRQERGRFYPGSGWLREITAGGGEEIPREVKARLDALRHVIKTVDGELA